MKKIVFVLFIFSSLFCSAQKTEKLVVYFAFDKYDLDDVSKNKIDSVLKNILVDEIQITAHCDFVGSNSYNDALSLKRANEVKQYFISKKINESLINIKASGKRIPLNKNETEEKRSLNRRAEIFLVVKNPEPVAEPKATVKDIIVEIPPENSEISTTPHAKEPSKDIESLNMDSVEVGSTFILSNLNFAGGRHRLLPKSEKTLELLLNILITNPNLKIEIQGYVCCTGENSDGLDFDTGTRDLSVNRAKTIYEYLVKKGIDRKRLFYIGFGGSHKLVREITEKDKETNRRVEIKILKK